jgi:hypothetical protein
MLCNHPITADEGRANNATSRSHNVVEDHS